MELIDKEIRFEYKEELCSFVFPIKVDKNSPLSIKKKKNKKTINYTITFYLMIDDSFCCQISVNGNNSYIFAKTPKDLKYKLYYDWEMPTQIVNTFLEKMI